MRFQSAKGKYTDEPAVVIIVPNAVGDRACSVCNRVGKISDRDLVSRTIEINLIGDETRNHRLAGSALRSFAYCSAVRSSQIPPSPLRSAASSSCRPAIFKVKPPRFAISQIF